MAESDVMLINRPYPPPAAQCTADAPPSVRLFDQALIVHAATRPILTGTTTPIPQRFSHRVEFSDTQAQPFDLTSKLAEFLFLACHAPPTWLS
jgi:hypothetical protein